MRCRRRAFALPAALAALVVLSAVAALASIAARAALRESAALAAEMQSHAARAALRTRASIALARAPRGALLAGATSIAERDTALAVVALAWPWHRVSVIARGSPAIAELARATAPALPWCAAAVVGGIATVAPGTVSIGAGSSCTQAVRTETAAAIGAFADSLAADLVLSVAADTAIVYAGTPRAFVRARRQVVVTPGANVSGIVMAPVVTIETGASVRGMIVAIETLRVSAGATVIADENEAQNALRSCARLRLLGRAGLLLPP